MRNPFMKRMRQSPVVVRRVAEIGAAGVGATVAVLLAGFAVEAWRPGAFFTQIAPQHLAGLLVLCGALALASDEPRPYGWGGLIALAAVGATVASAVFAVAMRAFDGEAWMSLIASLAALLPFFLFRRFGNDES